jgi:type I restriction enzyme, S subunit
MKAGWQVKTLGDVCNFQRGLTYAKSDEVEISNNVVLRATNIDLKTNLLDFNELKYINDKVVVADNKKVKKDSLIICTASGSKSHLGKVAYVDDDYGYAFGGFMGMVTTQNELLPKYLFHLMTSEAYKDYIGALSDGANINNLKFDDLKKFQIPFPSIPEQQRIVAILDQAFEGIAKARANAEQNLQNARALFESHLQSVFTQRGEGWKNCTLKDISVQFGRGKSKHRPRNDPKLYKDGKYPFIQTGDIRNCNHTINCFSQTYNDIGLAQSKLWPKGTLCITIAANIAETGILGFDSCFPDSVIGVVVDENQTSIKFLEYLLQSFKAYLQSMGQGSAQDNINLGTFENQLFPFPPVDEQRTLVTKLDSLSEETQRLEAIYQRKIACLDELKKSLLQQAFAGGL